MYTKDNLLYITQLELLYKSCLLTLREQKVEYDVKHEMLSDLIPDHDSVDLLDSIEILHDVITNNEKYSEYKAINDMIEHAKSNVINVDSLAELEEQLGFTELEQEMGIEIVTGATLYGLINEIYEENDVYSLEELKHYMNGAKHWTLKLYYAGHDKQYVAVFS